MKSKAQNSIVFVLAIIAGSVLNGTIVQLGHGVIAPPPGYDFNTEEGLAAGMAFMLPDGLAWLSVGSQGLIC